MAFLNATERQALSDELKGKSFRMAKWTLRLRDPEGRLVYHRNSQDQGKWMTRFELKNLGVRVTLIETNATNTHKNGKLSSDYTFADAIVEPTPDNKN